MYTCRINGEDKSSWVNLTAVPHEDGYQWRKYGEKKIQGTDFTRSYFRCTYRDDKGCHATKQIQQRDNDDPPMFQVTYINDHTCNFCTTKIIDNNNTNNLALLPLSANPNIGRPDDNSSFSPVVILKQELQAAPPPLIAAISTTNLDEMPRYMCQEVQPLESKIYCSDSTPADCSSNSSFISCYTDEFDHHQTGQHAEIMVEEAIGLGVDLDDPCFFDDPHLLLLYENLMNYY